MTNITKVLYIALAFFLTACSNNKNENETDSLKKNAQQTVDSALLKIAVMPTLDCLPFYVAESEGLYRAHGVDVKLIRYNAQMDVDTAISRGSVSVCISDLVRCERMKSRGTAIEYLTSTDAYWQLVTTKKARVKRVSQLTDKLIGMSSFSATSMLSQLVLDSAKVSRDKAFLIQINDVCVRSVMMQTNQLDAMWATEPWATQARMSGCRVIDDSRNKKLRLGVVACQTKHNGKASKHLRQKQIEKAMKAYDEAIQIINRNGLHHYSTLITSYCKLKTNVVDSLPQRFTFSKSKAPDNTDIEKAKKWINL